jgi:acetate kinase
MMNKKSGMLGVSQKTSDNQEIGKLAEAGDERAILIEKMYAHQITKFVGSYIAAMGGTDAIVFTGGIGENDPAVREYISRGCSFLGIDFNSEANNVRGKDTILTNPGSKVVVTTVTTNEELVIAQETMKLTTK